MRVLSKKLNYFKRDFGIAMNLAVTKQKNNWIAHT